MRRNQGVPGFGDHRRRTSIARFKWRTTMIYLQQDFDLHPASPRTRDAFVALAQDALVAAAERHGARLIAAFFGNSERFFRITHFFELPSLGAFEAWRAACRDDAAA